MKLLCGFLGCIIVWALLTQVIAVPAGIVAIGCIFGFILGLLVG